MADDHRQAGGLAAALLGHCLTRAVTPEQINAGGTQGQLRRTGEVRTVDTDARTVELAFSSETEVERWFGTEVLDHRPGAMRSERLAGGAALLVNHDWDDQIGVVALDRLSSQHHGLQPRAAHLVDGGSWDAGG